MFTVVALHLEMLPDAGLAVSFEHVAAAGRGARNHVTRAWQFARVAHAERAAMELGALALLIRWPPARAAELQDEASCVATRALLLVAMALNARGLSLVHKRAGARAHLLRAQRTEDVVPSAAANVFRLDAPRVRRRLSLAEPELVPDESRIGRVL
jgi:hypothetical protein